MARVVLEGPAIAQALDRMAATLCARATDAPFAVVGIRRGGEIIASRLAARLARQSGTTPPVGSIDITLYRDDGFGPHDWPVVGTSHVDFDPASYTIVLVDDVLYTGRTVRAAIDALLDYGRPKAIRLAVLVDRGLRELPFAADAVGLALATEPGEHVTVELAEAGGAGATGPAAAAGTAADRVIVEPAPRGRRL